MVYPGWVTFAGVELVNDSRVQAYAALSGFAIECGTPELAASLGDAPYVDPVADGAVWVDPSVPESARFWGLNGIRVDGLSSATTDRQWTELLDDGGVPGAARRASREIEVTAVAFAADEAAMAYGMAWLGAALRGSPCAPGCAGEQLCVYAAAPVRPELPLEGEEPCLGGSGVPDPTWDPEGGNETTPGGDQLVRSLYDVVVVEGPEVVEKEFWDTGVVCTVRWLMRAGVPHLYRAPVMVTRTDLATPPPNGVRETIANYDPWGWQNTCTETVGCMDSDPFCLVPPLPPLVATAPRDPCNPLDPANYANPNGNRFTAQRNVIHIARGVGPDWLEKVPVVRIYSGALPMQRIIVRWYQNPTGVACGPNLDPCLACVEMSVPWIPRNSLLTLDGRDETATVDCPGPAGLQEARLYGRGRAPVTWPVFDCSTSLCLELVTDSVSVATDWWADVQMVTREDLT